MEIHSMFEQFFPKNDTSHSDLIALVGFIATVLICTVLLCMIALSTIFLIVYMTFNYIIKPLCLHDEFDDLELGVMYERDRFMYNYSLEYWNEEILDEIQRFRKDKIARTQFIDNLLPSVEYKEEEEEENGDEEMKLRDGDCAICLEDYVEGDCCRIFPKCKHMFHSDCIDDWLEKNLTCPICRRYVFGA